MLVFATTDIKKIKIRVFGRDYWYRYGKCLFVLLFARNLFKGAFGEIEVNSDFYVCEYP